MWRRLPFIRLSKLRRESGIRTQRHMEEMRSMKEA